MWYTPIAVGTVLVAGLIVTYLTGPLKPNTIDPKLLIPISDVCCCFLPKRVRDWLRCGVKEDVDLEKKVSNDIELTTSEGYNTLHTSPSAQTLSPDTKAILPFDSVIQKTINGTYDNPAMMIKD
jgi:hypothetical protein